MKSLSVPKLGLFVSVSVCVTVVLLSCCSVSALPATTRKSVKFVFGEENLRAWRTGLPGEDALAPGPSYDRINSTLVLAAKRTNRPDILHGFKHYYGGWNITNRHYWASVGFTGAFGFILAFLWFFAFGIALLVHHCCRFRIDIKQIGSYRSQRICLMLLIILTCTAAVGCILLSVGQDEFHGEAMHTLKYIVNQSDYTVETLRNVTGFLSLAKTINVGQVFLPSNVLEDVDKLDIDLSSAADTLTEKTSANAKKVVKVFNAVRSTLITVAAVMLVLALVGFFLAIFGHRHAIHIFVVSGWLLVAVTFVLCGVFAIINNAISDTCLAMDEWVDNPQASTALTSILPCVDQKTTNMTLVQSKQVVNDLVNIVNTYIYTYANANPSSSEFNYHNQSGPLMPPLCYPFDSQLKDRQCASNEVSMANASKVWQNFTCEVSQSGQCTTVGRITPDTYAQLVAAVSEGYALEYYAPVLLGLQDCKFVRDTFEQITSHYCPPLEKYLRIVNGGLGLISVGVLLCLVLWMLYANLPQREEVFVKKSSENSRRDSEITAIMGVV